MRKGRFFVVLLIVAVVGGIGYFGYNLWDGKGKKVEVVSKDAFDVIDEAYDLIQHEGVHPVDGNALIEGALRGMADVIEDPYSTYLTKEEALAHRESLASERVGIGAEITRSNGKFIIVAPVKGAPADDAGLQPYDEIIRVDDENIAGLSLEEIVKKIKGKKGTTLQLTIYRPELNKHLEISVIRDAIPMKTVAHEMLEFKKQKIGYISIATFGEETAKEWKVATDGIIEEEAKAMIIDVRGNPGGYLHSVAHIVSSLVEENTIFAYMEDANGALTPLVAEDPEEIEFNEKLKGIPIVLLQDKGSASASEVLGGALQDTKRAVIIGTESFGKGTVQETFQLSNDGEMKLSTNKWLTPKEKWIHGKGIAPNVEAKQDPLFYEHIRIVTEVYKKGDLHDDIAYAQRLLNDLGYTLKKEDGYFDAATESAVQAFRKKVEIKKTKTMDRAFFTALKEEVEAFKNEKDNDHQLQMSLDYLLHELK